MASSASSLHYLSLTPQTLSFSKPNTSFSSLSFPFSFLKLSLSSTSSNSTFKPFFESSRFVRNVAVSSDFDQIENVFDSEEDEGETNYSPDAKLFVGNLPFSVDSAALAGLFERAGNIEMVEVIYDKATGRSRGFAFVTMSTPQEAEAAAQQFNGYELDGRALRVNSGPPPPKRENSSFGGGRESSSFRGGRESSSFRGGRESSSFRGARGGSSNFGGGSSNFGNTNRVYVGNLSWGVDDRALETLFSEQGRVMEAKVVYDRESGRSRGFGFVTYSSANEVNSAIEALDGVDLDGRSIRVSAAEARQRREF